MRALQWNISRTGDETRLALVGDLTEATDFRPLLQERLEPPLVFDFAGVGRINSCGLRAWIRLVIELNKVGRRIIVDRASPPVVGQLNLISNFVGEGGEVRSVYAPYYCAACDVEHLDLVEVDSCGEVSEQRSCPNCGADATFSDLREYYFSFWRPS